jgi:hypothetical protein
MRVMPIEKTVEDINSGPEMRRIVRDSRYLDPGCFGARRTQIDQSIANSGPTEVA